MKSKTQVSSQLLVVVLTAIVLVFMIQLSNAQVVANNMNQSQTPGNQNLPRGNVLAIKVSQESLTDRLIKNTYLSYYQQFLGPTLGGNSNETYNIFQASGVGPEKNSGRAPLQSFHAANIRHQINSDWGIGASIAVSNGYTGEVQNPNGDLNRPEAQWFNARAFVNLPSFQTKLGTLFSTVAYEAPTSEISKDDEMRWGWVVSESFAFKLDNPSLTAGITAQAYRMYYTNNQKPYIFENGDRGIPTQLQTLIVSGGPYVNYRMNDHWQIGESILFDWDQRGVQSGTGDWGNNLPHRSRTTLTYFPSTPALKYVTNVGVFAQALLKFRPETTAVGAEFGLRF